VVYPGFIKVAARESLKATPQALLEGAVAASKESGYLIEMHTEKGADVEHIVDQLVQWGFSLDRLVICHIDKRPDLGLHQELAEEGCGLEYDTFFRPKYHPGENLWPLIKAMVESGYDQALILATDLADSSLWTSYGGQPGLAGFPGKIQKQIAFEINDTQIAAALMGGNIARRLAIPIKES
jgi:phosphotriesterase-related protein